MSNILAARRLLLIRFQFRFIKIGSLINSENIKANFFEIVVVTVMGQGPMPLGHGIV